MLASRQLLEVTSLAATFTHVLARLYFVSPLVVVYDLRVEALFLRFVRQWIAVCSIMIFRRISLSVLMQTVSTLFHLFLSHHIAQCKKAGRIGIAFRVFVGQARITMALGLLLPIARVKFSQSSIAHAPTSPSANAIVRLRQPVSSLTSGRLQPRLILTQKYTGAKAAASSVRNTSVMSHVP